MNELETSFNAEISNGENKEKIIKIKNTDEDMLYKFIIGADGIWKTIQDFSKDDTCIWTPKNPGNYTMMIQGKYKNSKKPFDCITKEEIFILDNDKQNLISDIKVDGTDLTIGEKLTIKVISIEAPVLYRFWIGGKQGWEPIKDYTSQGKLVYTAIKEGRHEILVECKRPESKEKFDDYKTVIFDVKEKTKIEIVKFKCLTREILVNEELVFKVETTLDNKRILLYKFIKVSSEGKCTCIQDFSSRQIVSYKENQQGEYKLLCLVRDILSTNSFDDRAVLHYKVKPYNKVVIKGLRADIKSPQLCGSIINLKAEVKGGRELVYRYLIEGPLNEDTGYTRTKDFSWQTQKEGDYKITLFVKDISSTDGYEDIKTILYKIDKKSEKPVRIVEILSSRDEYLLVSKPINISVRTEGGVEPRYSFIVYKNNIEIEKVQYGLANWVDFIPEDKGNYELEVRVKDKYSIKEYDSNDFIKIRARDYIPAKIDYILVPNKERHIVGESLEIKTITENTKDILMRYITKIDGRLVEETEYIKDKRIIFKPQCKGKYSFEIYAKNIKSQEEYDCKKEVKLYVYENMPVINTKISYNKEEIYLNKEITFNATSQGGKDVCYEFYIMENGNWVKMQGYSKKSYYTFIPFLRGQYKVMVMSKSFYKNVSYEDYDELTLEVK